MAYGDGKEWKIWKGNGMVALNWENNLAMARVEGSHLDSGEYYGRNEWIGMEKEYSGLMKIHDRKRMIF